MNSEFRLIHFNSARPSGAFNLDNEFVRVFMAILPRIFEDADSFEGLHWHNHGVRRPNGDWYGMEQAFPYPQDVVAPNVCTMAGWESIEALRAFSYNGRTHPLGMRRLADQLDRSEGASFVMWWAPRGQRFTMQDGWDKLSILREKGPTEMAFSLDHLINCPVAA
ncbi:MAG: DUF3291 domain-containing protein [Hyphomonas sp.]|nr:DUF3291 domain-containing protein [Hyphomonas sp.]